METPKWEFFERLEKLEKLEPKIKKLEKLEKLEPKIEKLEKLERTLDRVDKLGVFNFELFFVSMAMDDPSSARKFKDSVAILLKDRGLSKEFVEAAHEFMLGICEELDK